MNAAPGSMQTHQLMQGSPEWHAHRAQHFNASDAPAMMGVSDNKSRTELLDELSTGLSREFSNYVQERVLDKGHEFEGLARPLAEQLLGEELYPVVGSRGRLSASFDGLTMLEDTGWEHKSLNAELREAMKPGCTGADLPMKHQVQMEQQCIVSRCKRMLFMASEWAANGTLIEERHCWYTPNPELAAQIIAGWAQLEHDLLTHVVRPAEVKPEGKAPETLPALRIEVTGAVTASNLVEFKQTALAAISSVNRDLKTDQDFADAEKSVKWCSDIEDRLKAAKDHALSQTASIDELFRTMDDIGAEARRVRLDLEKLVKARKEAIRGEIVAGATTALMNHVAALNAEIAPMALRPVPADFGGAIKNKRTVASLQDAVDTTLAAAKIAANAQAQAIRANLAVFKDKATGHEALFADLHVIVHKAADDFSLIVSSRIAEHQALEAKRLEAERERIRAEEAARLQREAQLAESTRIQAEKDAAAAQRASPVSHEPGHLLSEAASDAAIQALRATPPIHTQPASSSSFDEPATLNVSAINARLAPFGITAAGMAQLGIEPVGREGSARTFTESQFTKLVKAAQAHFTKLLQPVEP